MGFLRTNLFQIFNCVFVPSFCYFVDFFIVFGEFIFQNSDESRVCVKLCKWQLDTTYYHQDYEKINFYKNGVFMSLVGPSETRKSQFKHNWLKLGTFEPKIDKNYFFQQYYQQLHDVMQKEVENLELVQGVDFEFRDSFKSNGTKYLLIFDDSCEVFFNSKAFVDITTAGSHRGLRTIYNKHNLFHQSKLGRDVELQNTYNVLFQSLRDVKQISTISAQLELRSELVDWY